MIFILTVILLTPSTQKILNKSKRKKDKIKLSIMKI